MIKPLNVLKSLKVENLVHYGTKICLSTIHRENVLISETILGNYIFLLARGKYP